MRLSYYCKGLLWFFGLGIVLLPAWTSAAPESTVGLSLDAPTVHSVKVTWKAVPGASRYELSIGTDSNAANRGAVFADKTTYVFEKLMPGTIYYLKGRAIISGRAEGWCPVKTFSTVIPPISDLQAGNILDTTAQLSWAHRYQDLPYMKYEIHWTSGRDAGTEGESIQTDKNHLFFTALKPDTAYVVKIRAVNPLTAGAWSEPLTFTTLPYSPGTAPASLKLVNKNPKTVTVAWDAVPNADKYEIAYDQDPIFRNKQSTITTQRQFQCELLPNRMYYFKVRSLFEGRPSYWSPSISFLTLPAKPEHLKITGQTIDQVMISWQTDTRSTEPQVYELQWNAAVLGGAQANTYTALGNFTFNELVPGQAYALKIRTLNREGTSEWSSPLTVKTLPKFKGGLDVVKITSTRVDLKWQAYGNARAYELSYGTDVEAQNKNSLETKKTELSLSELLPGVTYYARVRPLLRDQTLGSWSEIISFSTYAVPTDVSAPVLEKINPHQAWVQWTSLTEDVTTYEIMLTTAIETIQGKVFHQSKPPLQLNGLSPNTQYAVKIRAHNLGGPGQWSDITKFITPPDAAPEQFTVEEVTATEAMLSWKAPAGDAPFSFILQTAEKNQKWQTFTDFTSSAYNLKDLKPATQYQAKVCIQNKAGRSSWSPLRTFKTKISPPTSAPANLRLEKVSDIAATVTWDTEPLATGYQLSYGTDIDAGDRGGEKTDKTAFTFHSLMPDTSYYVKVNAFNATGEGPWSDIVLIATKPSPPIAAPANVSIIDVTDHSITLHWKSTLKALRYEVSIGTDPLGENGGHPKACNMPPYVFNTLQSGTSYLVKVRNVNRGGGGPWSRVLKATTQEE